MRWVNAALFVLLWVGLVLGLYWYYVHEPEEPTGMAEVPAPAPEVPAEEQRYPVPDDAGPNAGTDIATADAPESEPDGVSEPEASEPLPPLGESDEHLWKALAGLAGEAVLDDWLKRERIVERLVATINSLDGESISLRFWPVRHLDGLPAITRSGETMRWSAVNTVRYQVAVEVLTSVDPHSAARVYFRNYPLFQEAWATLGTEPAYFNDRLVEVVDHLLGAPAVEPGFRVKQPKVLYEFADPALESESWGRKMLMRMGPENAEAVKDWLRRLRVELVSGREATR